MSFYPYAYPGYGYGQPLTASYAPAYAPAMSVVRPSYVQPVVAQPVPV